MCRMPDATPHAEHPKRKLTAGGAQGMRVQDAPGETPACAWGASELMPQGSVKLAEGW